MAKTKEELIKLKDEYSALKNKLSELSEDELKQITGGIDFTSDWMGRAKQGSEKIMESILELTPERGK